MVKRPLDEGAHLRVGLLEMPLPLQARNTRNSCSDGFRRKLPGLAKNGFEPPPPLRWIAAARRMMTGNSQAIHNRATGSGGMLGSVENILTPTKVSWRPQGDNPWNRAEASTSSS